MEDLPRIAIVVPSFNAAETIDRTLESLISQGYPALQIICMDGDSTDGTQEIVERFSDHISVFVSERDRSQADALNKGFGHAEAEILGWLCADDELAEGALLKVGRFLTENPSVDVVTGGCLRVFSDSSFETMPGEDFYDSLNIKNTIEQPSTLWRKEVYEQIGDLNLGMKYAFDWEYWCRMKKEGFSFSRISEVLSVYHFSETNLTSTGGRGIVREMYQIVREFGPYKGRLAWAFMFLYLVFDLRGFYDQDREQSPIRQRAFHAVLRFLYALYDRESINLYNWNFASRQERGLGW